MWLTRQPQLFPGWASVMPPGYTETLQKECKGIYYIFYQFFFSPFRCATDSLPTLFAVVVLFVWPADFSEFAKGIHRPLLTWQRVQAKLPWDLLIFQGGIAVISSLADASYTVHYTVWIFNASFWLCKY